MLTVQVALPVPLPRAFDYLPEAGRAVADYAPGTRVRVPFGRRTLTGLVLGSGELAGDPGALREIGARLDDAPLVDAELLKVAGLCQGLKVAAGKPIFKEGDAGLSCLLLAEGDLVLLLRSTPKVGDLVRCADPDQPGRYVVGRLVAEQGEHRARIRRL